VNILKKLKSDYIPVLYKVLVEKEKIHMIQQRAGKYTLKQFASKYKKYLTVKD
jgi:hypothetical protein